MISSCQSKRFLQALKYNRVGNLFIDAFDECGMVTAELEKIVAHEQNLRDKIAKIIAEIEVGV